jgi:hypothetical protein
MLARATFRAAATPAAVARRGFQTTRAARGGHGPTAAGQSPYHYPEGPRSNLPFDPLKKGFAIKFWAYAGKRTSSLGMLRSH